MDEDGDEEAQPPPADLANIPEALLGPLLETAGDVLRASERDELPPTARRLAGFGRKGLATPAARAQLRRLLEGDEAYRATVVERYLARDDVAALLAAWETGQGRREAALRAVGDAAGDGSLPLLAAALAGARPPGWELGLGLAIGTYASEEGAAAIAERADALEGRLAAVEEARRRADEARSAALAKAAALEEELREERKARRAAAGPGSQGEPADARRRAATLEAELAAAREQAAAAEARAGKEAERARAAEARGQAAQQELSAARRAAREADELRAAVAALATETDRLAGRLTDLASPPERATPPGPATPTPPAPEPAAGDKARRPGPPPRRVKVNVPLGMRDDTARALTAILGTPRLQVVVDGYNVSMLAWPDASVAEQRNRLTGALGRLHLRIRRPLTVVFDGAGVEGARPARRPGVTVLFSAAGVDADDVVVEQVGEWPPSVPVLVVSSDAAVREQCEALGAHVVSSLLFLEVLRR